MGIKCLMDLKRTIVSKNNRFKAQPLLQTAPRPCQVTSPALPSSKIASSSKSSSRKSKSKSNRSLPNKVLIISSSQVRIFQIRARRILVRQHWLTEERPSMLKMCTSLIYLTKLSKRWFHRLSAVSERTPLSSTFHKPSKNTRWLTTLGNSLEEGQVIIRMVMKVLCLSTSRIRIILKTWSLRVHRL